MEADPGTFDRNRLSDYVALGVNRFSIGIQAFQEVCSSILFRLGMQSDSDETVIVRRLICCLDQTERVGPLCTMEQ